MFRHRLVRAIAVGSAAALVVGFGRAALASGDDARAPARAPGAAPSSAEQAASAQARASGHRVEVTAKRAESSETFAEPDGTFTAELHTAPVRVHRDGAWLPIDTTLARRPDGTIAPAATVTTLAFSGGGSGPMVRLTSNGKQISLDSPWRLPVPRLSGDTATYQDVLPGVDLQLTARAQGFRELLVVKTRAAGRNPQLAKLRFGTHTTGLRVRAGTDGASDLVDSAGHRVFTSPAPQMWDAAGTHRATGHFEHAASAITVVPEAGLLSDPATVFPVSIDPDYNVPINGWTNVLKKSGVPVGSPHWNGAGDTEPALMKAGYSNWDSPVVLYRSYIQYNIHSLHGALIISNGSTTGAEFNAHETWAPACTGPGRNYAINLYAAGHVNTGTVWNNQPAIGANLGSKSVLHGHSGCGPAWIGWAAGSTVRAANNAGSDTVTFLLRASDENEPYGWKKFDDTQLLVHYDWPPNAPSNLSSSTGTNTVACSGVRYVNNAAGDITLRATASDRDAGQPLWLNFEWWTRDHATRIGFANLGPQSNPSVFTGKIPKGSLADGKAISWRAITGDGIVDGPWDGWCDLTIDNTAPAPPVFKPDPPPAPNVGVGEPATFTVGANGSADVTAYRYGLREGGTVCGTSTTVNTATLGGDATFSVTPLRPAFWDLWVTSVDRAGNISTSCATVRFEVQPGAPAVARWTLDGRGAQTAAPDATGHGHDATVPIAGTTAWTFGPVGDALHLNGTSASYVAPGGGAAVHTNGSFSVAAWVKLDKIDANSYAAVSQDGGRVFGYYLGYVGDQGRFVFRMVPQDSETVLTVRAAATAAPQVGLWTHLAGVYDAGAHEMRLYVNGVLNATTPINTTWDATGGVQLGRDKYAGTYRDYWPGAIDDAQIFDRVLSDLPSLEPGEDAPRSEIDRLASPPNEQAYYALDGGSGTTAGDTSGGYRTATLTGNAAMTAAGHVGGAVQLGGTGVAATAGPAVRTDTSYTAMAFVKLDAATAVSAALSQDGAHTSGFALQYRADGHWGVSVAPSDVVSPALIEAASPGVATLQQWTHLAGVYDAGMRQIRLYVNGVLAGSTAVPTGTTIANVAGKLVIGRSIKAGVAGNYWHGAVDEVHVYSGVLSDRAIATASGQDGPRAPSVYAGQFSRYSGHDNKHFVGTGPPPIGYHFESSLGLPAPAGAPDTRMIYSCHYADGWYLDPSATCSGNQVLGPAGLMYTSPPTDVPMHAVYRCLVPGASEDHFVSFDVNCEGKQFEFLLGYTRAYGSLVRYTEPGGDHWTAMRPTAMPATYQALDTIGMAAIWQDPGTVGLTACLAGSDEFLSTDATCGGSQVIGSAGWVWPDPPDDTDQSAQLYSCTASDGERFESLDRFCEGAPAAGQPLGYVITAP